ncbi:acyl-CoA carboxylase subunit epsilon [Streptomyces johnsoniae]|uniref:Acyl-CoA carboxylase subunit epsilon n=1 Tax=Streptomyces johnsoniae TaxID=3075532 RepID=A0ABU2S3B0_9ACTN|nr:acyl-CoA carboxylase subunit epsilon [Streptomyces sp. DSM 41886]MDT0442565.1 acyl-CoA carboxylase subunit epsilon [Streptomyces sp. DSM 41886]
MSGRMAGTAAVPGPGGEETGGIRVVRGNPADDEVAAAVTAVLMMLTAAENRAAADQVRGRWSAPTDRMTRRPVRDGWA